VQDPRTKKAFAQRPRETIQTREQSSGIDVHPHQYFRKITYAFIIQPKANLEKILLSFPTIHRRYVINERTRNVTGAHEDTLLNGEPFIQMERIFIKDESPPVRVRHINRNKCAIISQSVTIPRPDSAITNDFRYDLIAPLGIQAINNAVFCGRFYCILRCYKW